MTATSHETDSHETDSLETGAEDWEESGERTGRAYDLVPPPPPAPRAPSGHFVSGSHPVRLTDQA